MRATLFLLAGALVAAGFPAVAAEWNTPESRARWATLSQAIFGPAAAHLQKTDRVVTIDAPANVLDAALVPVTLATAPDAHVAALDLVIDQNPAPLAAKIHFGPAGDPRLMTLRVRVDGFTNIHAIAETTDGKLFQTAVFVQAAGGCSAPVGADMSQATAHMGEMRLKLGTNAELGDAPQATLMIRHPNFNGMQMNQATRTLTPARFIKSITVTRGDARVFEMTSDISLSTDPVIAFLYRPGGTAPFTVTVADTSGATWTQTFAVATN